MIVRQIFDTRVPTSAVADHRLQELDTRNYISSSIVQPLISLLLQSAAFKLGFRAFKHLAASAISRGCLIPGILFSRNWMALPRSVPRRTDAAIWMLVCRDMLPTGIVSYVTVGPHSRNHWTGIFEIDHLE